MVIVVDDLKERTNLSFEFLDASSKHLVFVFHFFLMTSNIPLGFDGIPCGMSFTFFMRLECTLVFIGEIGSTVTYIDLDEIKKRRIHLFLHTPSMYSDFNLSTTVPCVRIRRWNTTVMHICPQSLVWTHTVARLTYIELFYSS